jgi:translation initiation factor 2-alpha kinase 4
MDLDELYDIQQNEIEALQAIFMEDYQAVTNNPWKVSSLFHTSTHSSSV